MEGRDIITCSKCKIEEVIVSLYNRRSRGLASLLSRHDVLGDKIHAGKEHRSTAQQKPSNIYALQNYAG